MAKEYSLETFQDFMKVPVERIEKCLKDFSEAITLASAANELAKVMGEPEVQIKGLKFVDDNEDTLKVHLNIKVEK